MYRPEIVEYPNKKATQEKDILEWITELIHEGVPEEGAKKITVEDNTYWEEGKVSPEIMDLIGKTEAIQEAFKELREKRGEMGEKDIRHMIRVAELIRFAIDAGQIVLTADDRRDLLVAALCHDEGKVDDEVREILEKKKGEDLSEEERKTMQKHVRAGYYFLKANGEERPGRIMLYHHENNGKEGYPRRGERPGEDEEIRRLGRILSFVDKIEANGSRDRPYNKNRKAQDLKRAKEEALSGFNSPEEVLMISILEKIDPNNLTQRADEEDLQEMEEVRKNNIREMKDYTSS